MAIACSITLVIFGFEFIFTQNPLLFQTIKIIGALYLIYLGIRIIRIADSHTDISKSNAAQPSLATCFRQGLWGLFPLMIHIPRIRSLLLDHMTMINRVVGSALCLLGALAFL